MDQATWECIRDALSEMLGIAAITAIFAYLGSRGLEVVGTTAFRTLLLRLLKGFGKSLFPWLGVAILIVQLIVLIRDCL